MKTNPSCIVNPILSRVCLLGTRCCEVYHGAVEVAEHYQNQIKLICEEIDDLFYDRPHANGQYFHFIYCNGGRHYPIAPEDSNLLCNCKHLPFVQRLIQKNPWIKCSDRLPPEDFLVDVTFQTNERTKERNDIQLLEAMHGKYFDRYVMHEVGRKGNRWYSVEIEDYIDDKALAWRGLVQPYHGEE